MPKYKNGKVMYSRFKAKILIISKGHLDFENKIKLQRGPWKTYYKGINWKLNSPLTFTIAIIDV
jgi:hypothetical protein